MNARWILALLMAIPACSAASVGPSTASPTPAADSPAPAVRTDRVGNVLPPLVDEATWARLAARPVSLPAVAAGAPCPVTPAAALDSRTGPAAGPGPVYAIGDRIFYTRAGDGTLLAKVAWLARPEYIGPALIRGSRLDGRGDVLFDAGPGPRSTQLRFPYDTGVRAAGSEDGWRFLPSNVIVGARGCYGFQIDGLDWTITLVLVTVDNATGS